MVEGSKTVFEQSNHFYCPSRLMSRHGNASHLYGLPKPQLMNAHLVQRNIEAKRLEDDQQEALRKQLHTGLMVAASLGSDNRVEVCP